MAAGQGLGDQVRLVFRVELVAEILDMALDGPRSDPELLGALLRRQTAGDALQHLALSLGQGDEVFLLPRKIHHKLRTGRRTIRALLDIPGYNALTAS
jgi:hypothetical protein